MEDMYEGNNEWAFCSCLQRRPMGVEEKFGNVTVENDLVEKQELGDVYKTKSIDVLSKGRGK